MSEVQALIDRLSVVKYPGVKIEPTRNGAVFLYWEINETVVTFGEIPFRLLSLLDRLKRIPELQQYRQHHSRVGNGWMVSFWASFRPLGLVEPPSAVKGESSVVSSQDGNSETCTGNDSIGGDSIGLDAASREQASG